MIYINNDDGKSTYDCDDYNEFYVIFISLNMYILMTIYKL